MAVMMAVCNGVVLQMCYWSDIFNFQNNRKKNGLNEV